MNFYFFFQAEDGIRDYKVTGVQTCALPILPLRVTMPGNEMVMARQSPFRAKPATWCSSSGNSGASRDFGEMGWSNTFKMPSWPTSPHRRCEPPTSMAMAREVMQDSSVSSNPLVMDVTTEDSTVR